MTCEHQAPFGLPGTRCGLCAADAQLWRTYGITLLERDQLLAAQGEGCAICRYPDGWAVGDLRHPVDHDHSCCPGEAINRCCVRGVLCDRCNRLLGRFEDSPDRLMQEAQRYSQAAKYLSQTSRPFQAEGPQSA
jgi:hypothetical protein